MGWIEGVLFCDGCGAEITMASLVVRDGSYFCCARCADGESCDCGLIFDEEESERPQAVAGALDYSSTP
jgi:hypothetical protein